MAHEVATRLKAPLDVLPGPQARRARSSRARDGRDCRGRHRGPERGSDSRPRHSARRWSSRWRSASAWNWSAATRCTAAARRPAVVRDRTVILVDDGLATGSTMQAAILALRQQAPARIVVAVPVGARETCERIWRDGRRGRVRVDTGAVQRRRSLVRGVRADDRRRGQAAARPSRRSAARGAEARRPRKGDTRRASCATAPARLKGDPAQYDALLDGIGDARVVLLGEATHGTHEFYRERAFITRRLIAEKGFAAVAVEADWPDAYRINRYVRGDERRRRRGPGARGLRPLPDLDVAQRRRARLRRLAAHAQRRAAGGQARGLLRPRPVQPSRVDAGGAGLSRQGRSRGGPPRAPPVRLLRSVRRGDAGVRLRRQPRPASLVRARGRHATARAASSARRVREPRRPRRRRRVLLRRAERAPGRRTPKSTTGRCSGAAPSRGTCAIGTWSTRCRSCCAFSTARGRVRASSCGRTTRISATRAPPRWASGAS